MYISDKDIEFIINATYCVVDSKEAPRTDVVYDFNEFTVEPLMKRYLYFVVREKKYMAAMMELLTRTCTPAAIAGTVYQTSDKTSRHAIVVDLNGVPSGEGYNRLQLERAIWHINAKALEREIFKISQQIVAAAAKFMAVSQNSYITSAERQSLKNRVSDDLWATFMVMQDVAGIKQPTQATKSLCQYYHEFHLSQKKR